MDPSTSSRRRRSLTSPAMEAGDPPTPPSPRPGPAPALSAPFVRPRRRLDSGGDPAAAAPALLRPSSSAPTRGPSSTARNKFPPCPPAGPPLPQPKPAAKKKTAAPRAKKGADRPPPSPSSPPPTARCPVPLDTPAACSTEFPTRTGSRTTALSGRTPAAVSPRKRSVCTTTSSSAASCPTSSRCRSSSRRAAPPAKKEAPPTAADRPPPNGPPPTPCRQPAMSLAAGCAADSTVVDAQDLFDEMPALSSSRVLAASPPMQRGSRCRGLAVSRLGAGVPQRPGMKRSELEDTSTSEVQRGKVNASTCHSDRRFCPRKSSSLTLVPSSSRGALATSTPPQAQTISHRRGVPAVSQSSAGDRRQPGTTRSELEVLSTSAVERGEVHTSSGHSDRRRLSLKSSSLTLAPPSSCRVLVTSPPPQAQPISRRPRVPAISRRGAGDRRRSGMTRIPPQLPDDLLVEILSRLPAKPVHRFKCVSKSWRDLISNPHHRKRLPQALAGLFYWRWCPGEKGHGKKHQFINLSVRGPPLVDPALAFLPNHASIVLADCCNGLLLLFSSYSQPRDYIVCNPATEKWVALPNSGVTGKHWFSGLAFDPAVSSHFHVLEYVGEVTNGKMGIFSSRTGGWSHSVKVCTDVFYNRRKPVFLNGMLHFTCYREVMAIDLETKEWRHIQLPPKGLWSDFFGKSQGCLVYSCADVDGLSLWTLEDYDSGAWSLKHRVSLLQIFGEAGGAFHPECNTLFYSRSHQKGTSFMSYDFDRGELCHIAATEFFCIVMDRLLPYVPFFGDIGI